MEKIKECNCCKQPLLYALMQITKERKIIISANETENYEYYLEKANNNDENITIDMDTAEDTPYQIVYGALLYHGDNMDDVIEDAAKLKKYALLNLEKQENENRDELAASAYSDIRFLPQMRNREESIPFAALMQTTQTEQEHISVTLFPCLDMSVFESMVNRSFLLACRKFVKIPGLTEANWDKYIDTEIWKEAYLVAERYTGPA